MDTLNHFLIILLSFVFGRESFLILGFGRCRLNTDCNPVFVALRIYAVWERKILLFCLIFGLNLVPVVVNSVSTALAVLTRQYLTSMPQSVSLQPYYALHIWRKLCTMSNYGSST